MSKRGFGSDNHSGVHPRILQAIAQANIGHAPSYGTDDVSVEASQLMKKIFGADAETFFVFNGTAANVLALAPFVRSHHAVIASDVAHIHVDECGAPEKQLGIKILPVKTPDGKLTPELIRPLLVRRGDQHTSQLRAISITQPTEVGTVYRNEEIKALTAFARKEKLFVHMDGARLVNAAASLGCDLKSLTTDCDIDVLSLGGTKNGLLFGEAVIFLKSDFCAEFKFTRKQMMQLPSKTRFLAAQFLEFLGTDLWLENSGHANRMAQKLGAGLRLSRFARVTQNVEANGVFVQLPRRLVAKLRELSFFYVMNEHNFECRLMCSWDTQEADIQSFLETLERLGAENPELARLG